jgi:hypothetical protein
MIRYVLGAVGLSAIVAAALLAINHHTPLPPSSPPPVEREAKPYGKGDLLFVHRDPPPLPIEEARPPPIVLDAEPPPPPRERKNICERSGGVKVELGRSWHCRYPKRRR